MRSSKSFSINVDTAVTYRIRVQGTIDPEWFDFLSDFRVSSSEQDVTVLTGTPPDQAALFGVLNALYDLHIPLLSIELLDEEVKSENSDPENEPSNQDTL